MDPWSTLTNAILLIIIPILLAITARRQITAPWRMYFAGGAVFALGSVILLPLGALLRWLEVLPDALLENRDLLLAAIFTGLVIELARTIIIIIFRQSRTPSQAILIGLGSGGFMIMVVAVLIAASISSSPIVGAISAYSVNTSINQPLLLAGFINLNGGDFSVVPSSLILALLILIVEVNASFMVIRAFDARGWWLVPVAMLYHSVTNGIVLFGLIQLENAWVTNAILFLFSVPLLIFLGRWIPWKKRSEIGGDSSLRTEFQLLYVSFQKELLYHWRTRRILVIGAIFLVFGMASPLIAKFTPSLLGLIEGAEQFADLIPSPTAADAIGQYIKNITQFGFILAIVIGMGSVAGEKERHTAAMILSKPMPRWVFLVSKFMAQAVVYTIAFALAMIAAYYYTVFLFGRIDFFDFVYLNGLLLIWLSVFVAFTLFGSTIGRSTAAAAGIALFFCAILLVAGTIPQYGTLAPGGLINWASTLFIGDAVEVNEGSLTTSLVLILLAILGSLAVFEEQEV